MKWIFRIESCRVLAELVLNIIDIMLKRLFTHSFFHFSQSFLEKAACVYYMCPHFNCLHLKCSLADFPWAIEATLPKWPKPAPNAQCVPLSVVLTQRREARLGSGAKWWETWKADFPSRAACAIRLRLVLAWCLPIPHTLGLIPESLPASPSLRVCSGETDLKTRLDGRWQKLKVNISHCG